MNEQEPDHVYQQNTDTHSLAPRLVSQTTSSASLVNDCQFPTQDQPERVKHAP